ncbi:hypothetical protein CEB3_c07770 [Peptococcaceae bacterium CEB3]|nr:hypothetical protein CEB3_c07770 [Peptococcaceae bacterium CEB3]
MDKQRIGIPRAFFYYIYYPAWRTFFEALGSKSCLAPIWKPQSAELRWW